MARTASTPTPTAPVTSTRKPRELTEAGRAALAAARGKERVPAPEFVHAWMNGDTVLSIAATLELSVASVQARAKTLRKNGVKLPERPSGGPGRGSHNGARAGFSGDRINQLNALIEAAEAGRISMTPDGQVSASEPAPTEPENEGSEGGDDDIL